MNERVAIVGTAQSWSLVPWNDPGLTIMSLNDAYRLPGFQRADRWYDFHPIDKFFNAGEGPVYSHQVPPGHYARPPQHLEWLEKQAIPIYLHPDYATQHAPAADWAHAHAFPRAAIEAHFGRYFTSSPAWMMAHAILDGCREVHVYGVHLATEFEYIKQRPNFEFLMGCLLGSGKRTMRVQDGVRRYESQDGCLVLPVASPVLQESFQYAFDPRPDSHLAPIQWELHKLGVKQSRVTQALMSGWAPWVQVLEPNGDQKPVKRRVQRATLRDELVRIQALIQDWQEQMARTSHPAGAL